MQVASLNMGEKIKKRYRFVKKCLIPCLPISYSFSSKFAFRINFSGPLSSSWNTIFPCSNRTLFLIFSRIIWRFFFTFCCSCRVLSSLATHTWEALFKLIWLDARLSKGSFCDTSFYKTRDTCNEFLISIFLYIYKPSTRPKQKKFLLKRKSSSLIEKLTKVSTEGVL